MKISILLLPILFVAKFASGFANNIPIPGHHVGLTYGGTSSGLKLEIFYDLLCEASAYFHTKILETMEKDFLGKKVKDVVEINFVFFPLSYHHGTWTVTKIVPYLIDLCHADASKCGLYKDYI